MDNIVILSAFFFISLWYCGPSHALNSHHLTGCSSGDLRALEGFLSGLELKIDSWVNGSTDCCSWLGVACDFSSEFPTKRVVGLALGERRLRGAVSKSLAGLDQLRFLNLSSNSFRGAVPLQLFHLKHLEVLDLSRNLLNGLIPRDTNLPSIRVFNISSNGFSGRHPLLVGSRNLEAFIIGRNSFSGPIDTSICSTWRGIQVLQLSRNRLSGDFPTGFGNCSSLISLSLNSNYLTGSLPHDLFMLPSLKQLYLEDNKLSGPLSDHIGNLSNIDHLGLSLNNFSGVIPDVFGKLGNLIYLFAHSNHFEGHLPASLLNMTSLRFLSLRNNSLEGEVRLNCTAMTQLNSLDLGSNHFHGPILDDISSCRELKSINLARIRLNKNQIPDSIKDLPSLSYLSLSNCGLRNLSSALRILQQCKNLTTLVLSNNFRGEEMPVNGIHGFKRLEVLVIPNCGLSGSIPQWLRDCNQLELLDMSRNRLGGNIPTWIGSLHVLFYLDLSNNSLTGEIPRSLTQIPGLISRNISLQESGCPDLPPFYKFNPVRLQYNQFMSLPPSLDLSSNRLSGTISLDFGNLKKLHVFNLNRNNISGSIPAELSGMTSLEVLDLSFNSISGTIPATLTNLSFLSRFSVANNHLHGLIPPGGQFSTFPNSSFQGNEGLCGHYYIPCSRTETPSTNLTPNETDESSITIIGLPFGIGTAMGFVLTVVFCLLSSKVQR